MVVTALSTSVIHPNFVTPVLLIAAIPEALKDSIEIRPTTSGATVIVRGELTEAIEDFLLSSCKAGKQQENVREAIER